MAQSITGCTHGPPDELMAEEWLAVRVFGKDGNIFGTS